MANLIPDVTGSLRINTTSAMSDYQNAMKNIRDAVASPGDLINKLIESNERDKRAAEEQKRHETELGFKQRQEQRLVDELGREQATREAVLANLSPERFKEARLREIDAAIAQGMANLSPQERAEAEAQVKANWDRVGSGNYALGLARDSTLADPSKVLSAQKSRLDIALSDPNSAEFKAAQQAEWDSAKRKMDYNHNQAVSLQKLKNKWEQDKDILDADAASNLLNVGTTYNKVVGSNADTIASINKANEVISGKQEAYGNAYVDAYSKNPNAKPEDIDAEARKAIGIQNKSTSIDRLIPLANVPKYEETTKVSNKPLEMYTKDLLDEAKRTGTLNSNTLKLIDSQTRAYESALKTRDEKLKEETTFEGLKGIIEDLKGDPNIVRGKDDAKEYIKALETKIKAEAKKATYKPKSSAYSGLIAAMDIESIDNYRLGASKTDQSKILEIVKQYKIPEKDAIAILHNANFAGKFSGSVASSFEAYVKTNYSK